MKCSARTGFAHLLIWCIFSVSMSTTAGNTANPLYVKAMAALENSRYDSSFYYLQTACAAGLPDDSLYYLWAQIYLERGVPDTALALNLAATRTNTQTLQYRLLEQRYLIYATLGWTSEAGVLLDSLREQTPRGNRFVPRLSYDTWSGSNNRSSLEGQPYPFFTSQATDEHITNPGQEIAAKAAWYFPVKNSMIIVPALLYTFANGMEQTELRYDSLDHSVGVSLGVKNLLPHISADYTLFRRNSIFDDLSTRHQISFSRSIQGRHWLSYGSLLYTIEKPDNGAVAYQCLWFMNYFSRPLSSSATFFILPLLTCFFADATSSSHTTSIMYIEDPQASPVVHYTDSTFAQPIPIPTPLTMISQIQLLSDYRAASTRRSYMQVASESYCGATPALGLTKSLPFNFSLEGTLKGMANYYLQEYEWTTCSIPYSAGYYDKGSWLAYCRSDGNYYLVQELGNIVTAERYSGPLDIRSIKKRRIDYSVAGEVLLERRFGNIGTFGINGYLRKYWSTLQDESPTKLKNRVFGFGASFKIALGAVIPANAY